MPGGKMNRIARSCVMIPALAASLAAFGACAGDGRKAEEAGVVRQVDPSDPSYAKVNYLDSVRRKVNEAWDMPLVFEEDHLSADVCASLGKDGALRSVWIVKRSGNSRFDQSAVQAVQDAAPFPALPKGMGKKEMTVVFNFIPPKL